MSNLGQKQNLPAILQGGFVVWLPLQDAFRTLAWNRIKENLSSINNLLQLANDFN